MENSTKPHAVLLASPGMGHINPVLELGSRLVIHHGFHISLLLPSTHSTAESRYLQLRLRSTPIDVVQLPQVDISSLVDQNATVVSRLAAMMRHARPNIRSALLNLKVRPTVLIVDLFGTEAFEIADEFKIPKYVFVASNAWFLALAVYSPILDEEVEGEFVDQKEPIRLPGCKPVRPEDLVDPMLDRTNQQYREHVKVGAGIAMSDGILLNTWEDLELTTLCALREDKILSRVVKVPIYPIGPVVKSVESGNPAGELMGWLDIQPAESVIYVSFGSGGSLSAQQITELAWGLELSQQRFIWVLRPLAGDGAEASFFSAGNGCDSTAAYLPDGFLSRTQNVGRVVTTWAPQVEILSHGSTGGFLSHCGWNSTLESLMNGVPMIAWPLYAEQAMNATMLSEQLGVAVRAQKLPAKGLVRRDEIEKMVRTLMAEEEGKAIRRRVREIQQSGKESLKEGMSSRKALSQMVNDCELLKRNNTSSRAITRQQ